MSGQRIGIGLDFLGRPLGDDLAAVHARPGADVDDIVGGEDRVLVVLDDDDGVAELAQALERLQEPRVVALMQPDRRLVEHIEHAGEPRADLRGEPDALALAARQRARRARKGEVIEADVGEEGQPIDDLLQDAVGDLVALGVELLRQLARPFDRRLDRQQADFADVFAVDFYRQRFGLEAEAGAGIARRRRHVALDFFARPVALRLFVAALEVGDHAFERLSHFVRAHAVVIGELHLLAARTKQNDFFRTRGQFGPWLVEPELVMKREPLERLHIVGRGRLRPRRDGALAQAQTRVGDDERGIDLEMRPQAAAGRAGAKRVVERKKPRLDLGDGEAGNRAGEF